MFFKSIQKILPLLAIALLTLAGSPWPISVQAKNYSVDEVQVRIQVNQDSTLNISEKFTYTFNDEMNGMFREITLTDGNDLEKCRQNPQLQCGGFESLIINKVLVNGNNVAPGRYQTEKITGKSQERLRVQYEFDNAPVRLTNETYTFEINYTIYGGLGFFDDYDLLYWNALAPDQDKTIKQAQITIDYPGQVSTKEGNFRIPGTSTQDYRVTNQGNQVKIETQNIAPGNEFTLLQKIPKGLVDEPARLRFKLNPDKQTMSIDRGQEWKVGDGQTLSLPANEDSQQEIVMDGGFMYQPQTFTVKLTPGEHLIESNLELSTAGWIITILLITINIIFGVLIVLGPILVWRHWKNHGKDQGVRSTIIPEYSPPKRVKAYMAGSLIDESVDNQDISSIIIDLAYKGYLEIEELEKGWFGSQDYLLTLTDPSKHRKAPLDETENTMLDMIFGGNSQTKLSELKNKAYKDLAKIKTQIYNQMVEEGYYRKNPQNTRSWWAGGGIGLLVTGLVLGIGLLFVFIFTLGLAMITTAIAILAFAKHMPAKTVAGGQAFMDLQGFKMYMETAEKDRMQNLTPEMFEAYLPFAIAFQLEKQWAAKFKDIYKEPPEWYHSQHGTFNTLVFANSLNSFTTSTTNAISSTPSSSGSGFSGGGGFSGGFSGGGGGGGSSGGW